MAQVRFIQGGVTTSSFRALVLARGVPQAPEVLVTNTARDKVPTVTLKRVPDQGPVFQALERRGVRAYLLEAQQLRAGTPYNVLISAGDARKSAGFSTLPTDLPEEGMTVAATTCYYDGYKRGSALQRSLRTVHRDHLAPLFHIWGGDNVYVDVPAASHASHPLEDTLDRYVSYLVDSDYAETRSVAPSFTTYDDHELWNNFPHSVPWLSRSWDSSWESYRTSGLECLKLFQSSLNPDSPGLGYHNFVIRPVSFFIMDTRSSRTRNDSQLLAVGTRQAFEQWIDGLEGPGVLVLGQPLWIEKGDWRDINLPTFKSDYAAIWAALRRAPYDVMVVSGDVHHSRVLHVAFNGAANRRIIEVVVSPACHIPTELATFGLGNTQGRGSLSDVPSGVENSGQSLTAKYVFGTDTPHALGLLTFKRLGSDAVRVGVSFVEHYPNDRFAPAKPIRALPRLGKAYAECHEPQVCVLRAR